MVLERSINIFLKNMKRYIEMHKQLNKDIVLLEEKYNKINKTSIYIFFTNEY